MPLKEISLTEFEQHLKTAQPVFFEQSPEMYKLLEKRGFSPIILAYKHDDCISVSAIAYKSKLFGGYHLEIHNGPVSTKDEDLVHFYKGLIAYAKKNRILKLSLKPYQTRTTYDSNGTPLTVSDDSQITLLTSLGFKHQGITKGGATGNFIYLKQLEGLTEDTLLASFSKKGRPLVKKALSFGIDLRSLKRAELSLFKEITESTSERREFDDKPLAYYETLYDCFGEHAEFLVATLNFNHYYHTLNQQRDTIINQITEKQDILDQGSNSAKIKSQLKDLNQQLKTFDERLEEAASFRERYGDEDIPLAASLFLYMTDTAYYLHSGSLPEFNRFYAPAVLQNHVMRKAIHLNLKTYNMVSVSGHFDGSDGVLRFKQNFNGYIEEKLGSFDYYPNQTKVKVIQLLKKCLKRS